MNHYYKLCSAENLNTNSAQTSTTAQLTLLGLCSQYFNQPVSLENESAPAKLEQCREMNKRLIKIMNAKYCFEKNLDPVQIKSRLNQERVNNPRIHEYVQLSVTAEEHEQYLKILGSFRENGATIEEFKGIYRALRGYEPEFETVVHLILHGTINIDHIEKRLIVSFEGHYSCTLILDTVDDN